MGGDILDPMSWIADATGSSSLQHLTAENILNPKSESTTTTTADLPDYLQNLLGGTSNLWSALQQAGASKFLPGVTLGQAAGSDVPAPASGAGGGEDGTEPEQGAEISQDSEQGEEISSESDADKSRVVSEDIEQPSTDVTEPDTGSAEGTDTADETPAGTDATGANTTIEAGAGPTPRSIGGRYQSTTINPVEASYGGSDWLPSYSWAEPSEGIYGNAAREVVGPSELENYAASLIPGMESENRHYLLAAKDLEKMRNMSGDMITGRGVTEDPAYLEAIAAFDQAIMPTIQNQAALAGLGRSTAMTNAQAAAKANYVLPMIQDYMGRQEDALNRQLGAYQTSAEGRMALGDKNVAQRQNAIDTAMNVGGVGRGISQEQADAAYNDWMRQADLFEQSLSSPLGMTPNAIGSTANATQTKG